MDIRIVDGEKVNLSRPLLGGKVWKLWFWRYKAIQLRWYLHRKWGRNLAQARGTVDVRRFWRYIAIQLRWYLHRKWRRNPAQARGTVDVRRFWRYKVARWVWFLRRQESQKPLLREWVEGHLTFLHSLRVAFRRYRTRYAAEFLPIGLVLVMVLVMLAGAWTVPAAASVVGQAAREPRPLAIRSPAAIATEPQVPQEPGPVVNAPVFAPTPSPIYVEDPISLDDAPRPTSAPSPALAPIPSPIPQIRVIDEGWAAHYAPGVMGQVIAVRQEGQVLHTLPLFEANDYLGFIARPDCAEIGQEVWLDFYQGWVGPFLVTDCAHPRDRSSIESRGIVAELDYASAVHFGVARTGGRAVRVGYVDEQIVSAGQ